MGILVDTIFKDYVYKNEQHKTLVGILFVAASIEAKMEKILNTYGITLRQFRLLRQLRFMNPESLAVHDINFYMINKMADASRLAERMAKAGLIEKHISPTDKRRSFVKITPKGLDLINDIDKEEDKFLRAVSAIGKDATPIFNEYLEQMLADLKKK